MKTIFFIINRVLKQLLKLLFKLLFPLQNFKNAFNLAMLELKSLLKET